MLLRVRTNKFWFNVFGVLKLLCWKFITHTHTKKVYYIRMQCGSFGIWKGRLSGSCTLCSCSWNSAFHWYDLWQKPSICSWSSSTTEFCWVTCVYMCGNCGTAWGSQILSNNSQRNGEVPSLKLNHGQLEGV